MPIEASFMNQDGFTALQNHVCAAWSASGAPNRQLRHTSLITGRICAYACPPDRDPATVPAATCSLLDSGRQTKRYVIEMGLSHIGAGDAMLGPRL